MVHVRTINYKKNRSTFTKCANSYLAGWSSNPTIRGCVLVALFGKTSTWELTLPHYSNDMVQARKKT